jgi:hypothetical protein
MSDLDRITPIPPLASIPPVRAPRKGDRDPKRRPKPDRRSRGDTEEDPEATAPSSTSRESDEPGRAEQPVSRRGGVNLRV